jgi:hypothetical protein
VQRHLVKLDPARLASTRVAPRGVDMIRPLPRNTPSERSAHVRKLPTGGFQRTVVARRAPPVVAADVAVRPGNARPAPNVRVLKPRRAELSARPTGEARQPGARNTGATATLPVPQRLAPAPAPRAEPRSARFAHPQQRRGEAAVAMPRPGVSYISPAARSEPSLPRVAPIRRAEVGEPAVRERPAPVSRPVADPPRVRAEPRVERAAPARPNVVRQPPREIARPAVVRQPPRPQPVQRAAPRPAPAPRATPPRREAPPVRAEVQRGRQVDHRRQREQ